MRAGRDNCRPNRRPISIMAQMMTVIISPSAAARSSACLLPNKLRLKGLLGAVEQYSEIASVDVKVTANFVFVLIFQ